MDLIGMELKDLDFVEKKGCITFSKACVNLGKAADLETGQEEYYCVRDFPQDCSKYGCPVLRPIRDHNDWKLKKVKSKPRRAILDRG